MTTKLLNKKRILITQADTFMGPTLKKVFAEHGADVITCEGSLRDPDSAANVVEAAGEIDVLVLHLGFPAPHTKASEVTDMEWSDAFSEMVDPLPRLCRAVLPQMLARKSGKILLMGSSSALRGLKRASTYCAARGAQISYIQALGVEMAPNNIQVNAIAQNFVENPTYFPPEVQANPRFQERLKNEVPLGRLVSAKEDAEFAAYLCSDNADCFVGQVFPVCGGWVAR